MGIKAQQKLYDVAEADVSYRARLLACVGRKRNLIQDRKRHGKDDGLAGVSVAIGAMDNGLLINRFNCAHNSIKMDLGAFLATISGQVFDQRSITTDDAC